MGLIGDPGVAGPLGPQGPAGAAGADGAAGPGLVWRDATDALVAPATGLSNPSGIEVFYFDPQKLAWPMDRELGQVTPAAFTTTLGISAVYYTGLNCTGTAYAGPVMPRFVFKVSGDVTYYVRPDALALEGHTDMQSFLSGITTPSCVDHAFTTTLFVMPLAACAPTPALTAPELPYVGPLHLSPT
jgi:hypothetical protein